MDKRKLNIQIARLLNESNEFECGFTVIGDEIWAMTTLHCRTPYAIDPAMYLEHIKAAYYEDNPTD